jgi:choline dehydrogenase-like flavoprotein
MSTPHYDLIIIGSGAGGGTLAYALASTGLKILILERGDYIRRERENWDAGALFIRHRYKTSEVWYDAQGAPFQPGAYYGVGGNTKVSGGALLRLRVSDFEALRHHRGTSPAWPLRYPDFQPYYLQAELLYSVHGTRGADPLEPPEQTPYLYPAIPHEARIQEIYDTLKQKGLHPFPIPLAIHRNEANPDKSLCVRCDTCEGFPCLVYAKADAHTTCIHPALTYPNVTLLTSSRATRLLPSADGRAVSAVEVEREGACETFTASVIVVACGAIQSAALLLRSNNLANSSGLVGRHYMCHNHSAVFAVSKAFNPTRFPKTLAINDYYHRSSDWEFPLGHIQLLGKIHKEMILAEALKPIPKFPTEYIADHGVGWWLISEDLPDPDNRVTLNERGDIVLQYTPNNQEAHLRLHVKLKEILQHIGCDKELIVSNAYLHGQIPLANVAHQVGTCRFGFDPKQSVLDIYCKAHDLDNLYVVDGSFFPSSGAVNPSLTIIANALRIADHLCQRFHVTRDTPLRYKPEASYQLG